MIFKYSKAAHSNFILPDPTYNSFMYNLSSLTYSCKIKAKVCVQKQIDLDVFDDELSIPLCTTVCCKKTIEISWRGEKERVVASSRLRLACSATAQWGY